MLSLFIDIDCCLILLTFVLKVVYGRSGAETSPPFSAILLNLICRNFNIFAFIAAFSIHLSIESSGVNRDSIIA